MVGNPYRYRVALQQLENRHATAGCLLALLFVVPFAAQSCSMAVLAPLAAVYALLVVPLAAGYFSLATALRALRTVIDVNTAGYLLKQAQLLVLWLHELYCSLRSMHVTITQVLFFVAAEKALCPEEAFISLYALLFYTMLAYLYQSLQSRPWAQLMFTTTTADFLRLTSAFIILRLGKGVAMSFVLISITLQFDHLEPTAPFVLDTGLYFVITQFLKTPGKENIVVGALQELDLQIFEGLEEYWVPLLTNGVAVLLTLGNVVLAMTNDTRNLLLSIVIVYTNIVVVLQQVEENCWLPLCEQLQLMARYPLASREDLAQLGEATCAVCLDDMRVLTARVTPCRHIFHGQCLRRCVLQYQQCPLCKQALSG